MAEALRLRNVSFQTMDACKISMAGFDLALSTDFYEHLTYEQHPVHLQSIWNALSPGGIYMIRAPHRSNIRQHMEGHIGLPSFSMLRDQALAAGFTIRFHIGHTALLAPVAYHIPVERWLESRKWSELAIYKGLQKCGLANVVAQLQKPRSF